VRPAIIGYGELEVTRHYPRAPGDFAGITIDRADPRILITDEMLRLIARGHCTPYAKFCAMRPRPHGGDFTGGKLEIRDASRKVVYIIRECKPIMRCWLAEWPD
jgi:hypothetical protein